MTATFATSDWARMLATSLEQSARVRTESVTWVHGPVLLVVEADAEHGTSATALRIDVHEGACRGVEVVTVGEAARVPFTITGTPARWKSVLGGELSIVDGILDSKLHARGDLPTIARHRALFDAVAQAAGELETAWADEAAEPANA